MKFLPAVFSLLTRSAENEDAKADKAQHRADEGQADTGTAGLLLRLGLFRGLREGKGEGGLLGGRSLGSGLGRGGCGCLRGGQGSSLRSGGGGRSSGRFCGCLRGGLRGLLRGVVIVSVRIQELNAAAEGLLQLLQVNARGTGRGFSRGNRSSRRCPTGSSA